MDAQAELIDWRVATGDVPDAPDLHWPVTVDFTTVDFRGNANVWVTRPDGTKLEVVLEVVEGQLAIRVYPYDAAGVEATEDGGPIINLRVGPANAVTDWRDDPTPYAEG
jgi:hypothetical protein